MISTEMDFAAEALPQLQKYGIAKLDYETAQFEPYSRRDQPDILFWPDSGPNSNVLFLIELRLQNSTQRLPSLFVLQERRDLLRDGDTGLRFALATTHQVDQSFRAALSTSNIEVIDRIESGSDLASRILNWSGARMHEDEELLQPFLLAVPQSGATRMSAATRADSLVERKQKPGSHFRNTSRPYNELFWQIFNNVSDDRPLRTWLLQLREFLVEENLESFDDLAEFLKFLEATVTEHQYTSNSTFNKENLRKWFKEFNRRKVTGSKL